MKIPKTLKIGGKVYTIEITDDLEYNCSAEISYSELVIRIRPQAEAKMESDLLHEMIHGIYSHLGYTKHDEKKIDELSEVLYAILVDNPDMF